MARKRSFIVEDPPAASSFEEVESEEEEELASGGTRDYESESDELDKLSKKPKLYAALSKPSAAAAKRQLESKKAEKDKDSKKKKNKKVAAGDGPSAATAKRPPDSEIAEKEKDSKKKKVAAGDGPSAAVKRPLESEKAEKEKDSKKKKKVAAGDGPSAAASKGPLESEKTEKEKDSKRKKKQKKVADADSYGDIDGNDEDGSHSEEDGKKSIDDENTPCKIQRLWSENDEIVILKGMTDCLKKGIVPTSSIDQFLDSIKESLHVTVQKGQLINKIRRLRNRYLTNVKRGKAGKDPVFSKPHDMKCYKFMKEIWGEKEGNNSKKG